jgi:hypothetical protein
VVVCLLHIKGYFVNQFDTLQTPKVKSDTLAWLVRCLQSEKSAGGGNGVMAAAKVAFLSHSYLIAFLPLTVRLKFLI